MTNPAIGSGGRLASPSLSLTVLDLSLAVYGQSSLAGYSGMVLGGGMLLSVPGMWVGRVEGM